MSCPDVAVRLSFSISLGSLYPRPNTSRIRAVLASAGSGVRGGSRGSAVSALGGLGARGGRPGSLTALTTVISYRLFLKTLSLNR